MKLWHVVAIISLLNVVNVAPVIATVNNGISSETTEPVDETCQPIRMSKGKARVMKIFWVKNGADYEVRSEEVCKGEGLIGVIANAKRCSYTYPVLARCEVELDKSKHRVTVSASISINDDPKPQTKHFMAGYHLDRNSGASKTGEAAMADAFTHDLSLQSMGLKVQSKFDGPSPGVKLRDGLEVFVDFEDSDAP